MGHDRVLLFTKEEVSENKPWGMRRKRKGKGRESRARTERKIKEEKKEEEMNEKEEEEEHKKEEEESLRKFIPDKKLPVSFLRKSHFLSNYRHKPAIRRFPPATKAKTRGRSSDRRPR